VLLLLDALEDLGAERDQQHQPDQQADEGMARIGWMRLARGRLWIADIPEVKRSTEPLSPDPLET
jgi:hypothetical protein